MRWDEQTTIERESFFFKRKMRNAVQLLFVMEEEFRDDIQTINVIHSVTLYFISNKFYAVIVINGTAKIPILLNSWRTKKSLLLRPFIYQKDIQLMKAVSKNRLPTHIRAKHVIGILSMPFTKTNYHQSFNGRTKWTTTLLESKTQYLTGLTRIHPSYLTQTDNNGWNNMSRRSECTQKNNSI